MDRTQCSSLVLVGMTKKVVVTLKYGKIIKTSGFSSIGEVCSRRSLYGSLRKRFLLILCEVIIFYGKIRIWMHSVSVVGSLHASTPVARRVYRSDHACSRRLRLLYEAVNLFGKFFPSRNLKSLPVTKKYTKRKINLEWVMCCGWLVSHSFYELKRVRSSIIFFFSIKSHIKLTPSI